jgi:hypothetical protein
MRCAVQRAFFRRRTFPGSQACDGKARMTRSRGTLLPCRSLSPTPAARCHSHPRIALSGPGLSVLRTHGSPLKLHPRIGAAPTDHLSGCTQDRDRTHGSPLGLHPGSGPHPRITSRATPRIGAAPTDCSSDSGLSVPRARESPARAPRRARSAATCWAPRAPGFRPHWRSAQGPPAVPAASRSGLGRQLPHHVRSGDC